MAAALPLKVRAARYAVAADAGLVDAVQSDTVARTKCQEVRERSLIKGQISYLTHGTQERLHPSYGESTCGSGLE
jgi:hypothetical protein